jgi:hypothetical protein
MQVPEIELVSGIRDLTTSLRASGHAIFVEVASDNSCGKLFS